jgi:hypothetical protein
MILYRPVGLRELELIAASKFAAYPPRLPDQPIFYPVLNVEYARQIAREWNTVDPFSGYCGFVTVFELNDSVASRYPVQTVGAKRHQELWIPAEELAEVNASIIGLIRVVEAHTGPRFEGTIDPTTNLPTHLRDVEAG